MYLFETFLILIFYYYFEYIMMMIMIKIGFNLKWKPSQEFVVRLLQEVVLVQILGENIIFLCVIFH
jgi:hypothetical protein